MSINNLKINANLQVVSVDQKEDSKWGFIKVHNESNQSLWLRLQALEGSTVVSGEVAHVPHDSGIFVAIDDTVDGLQLDQWDADSQAWQAMTLPTGWTPQPTYRTFGISVDSGGSVTTELTGRTHAYTSTSATLEITYAVEGFTGTLQITSDGSSPQVSQSVDFTDPRKPPSNPIVVTGVPTDATTLTISGGGTNAAVSIACMAVADVTLIPNGDNDPSAEPKVVTPPSGSSIIQVYNSSTSQHANLWFWDSGKVAPANSPVPQDATNPIDMMETPTTWYLDFDLEDDATFMVTPDPKIIVKRSPNTLTNPPS